MKIVWTPRARNDARRIRNWIARDRPLVAGRWAALLLERVALLAEAPSSGRMVPNFEDVGLRELIFRNYRVFYRLSGETVRVLRVWDARRELPERIGESEVEYGRRAITRA